MEKELSRLKADTDRLLACITPANAELIDEKLLELKGRRRETRGPPGGPPAGRPERHLDLEAATEAAMGYMGRFRDVVAMGTFAEQKAFVREFVVGIDYCPGKKRCTLQMINMGASSFKWIGWTPDVAEKTPCPEEWTLTFRHDARAWKQAA